MNDDYDDDVLLAEFHAAGIFLPEEWEQLQRDRKNAEFFQHQMQQMANSAIQQQQAMAQQYGMGMGQTMFPGGAGAGLGSLLGAGLGCLSGLGVKK
jgi:hypothetical protein